MNVTVSRLLLGTLLVLSGAFVRTARAADVLPNNDATVKLMPANPSIDSDTPITDRKEPMVAWADQVGECMHGKPRLEVTTYNGGAAKTYTLNPDGIIAANTKGNPVCTK